NPFPLNPLANNHHRTVRVPEHLLSSGTNKHLFESRSPAPPQNDQVHVIRFRTMDDLLNGMANGDIGLQFNAQVFCTLSEFLELLFEMLAGIIEHGIDL